MARKEEATEEVTLAKAHVHDGKDRQPGEKIKVTAAERDFLSHPDRQIIEGSHTEHAAKADDPAEAESTEARVGETGGAGIQGGASAEVEHSNPSAAARRR